MMNKIFQYADITFESVRPAEIMEFDIGDTEIQYDYFDSIISRNDNCSSRIYLIKKQTEIVGYVAVYCMDFLNRTACIYGKVRSTRDYGDLIKALLALLEYAFVDLRLKKLNVIYRQDNYFFDDVCKHLGFVREGLLRGQLACNEKHADINIYGLLDYEYLRFANGAYKRMFAWDYNYTPNQVAMLDLTSHFNRRLFTNSLDNPNHALMNDWYREYVMNYSIRDDHCLAYKNIKFPVNIFDFEREFDCFSCESQKIDVPIGNYTDLLLVTTAQFGNKQTHITAIYADGTSEEYEFCVGDWCEKNVRNEYVIHYAAACRELSLNVSIIKCNALIYLQRIRINSCKQLKSLIFPMSNNEIFIFAGALCEDA
jgi:hypothetical protein